MHNKITHEFLLHGKPFRLETGEIANHAQSSFIATYGETVVLITVTVGNVNPELDFFPLTVDYSEKLYAGGMISSSPYIKREGRPSDSEILHARLIDHAIRSLFPSNFRNETQVIAQVLSYDGIHDPVLTAMVTVSFAFSYSGIPFLGPYGVTKIGYINNQIVLNPTLIGMQTSELDMFVSSTREGVVSVEAESHDLNDEIIKHAIVQAIKSNELLIEEQDLFLTKYGKKSFNLQSQQSEDEAFITVYTEIASKYKDKLTDALYHTDKMEREHWMRSVMTDIEKEYAAQIESQTVKISDLNKSFEKLAKNIVRKNILESGKRADGRSIDTVRPLTMRTGVLPRVHGSALFSRGETQTLSIVTLGSERDAQQYQDLDGENSKRYFHHYNMPGYANGEVDRKFNFANRRAIGHGAIGEKALCNMIASKSEFPYTIRVVSEVTSSNGSTSMAATCGSSLALMDAGVPVKKTIGGIGVGLVYEDSKNYKIVTDIIGLEDFYGDMDFKITGSKDGITAIQLDNKMAGIPVDVLLEAIDKSKIGRVHVIELMEQCISTSRSSVSKHAPKVGLLKINPEKIGELIGPGGKVIKNIIEKTGVEINVDDDGTVTIYGNDSESFALARKLIESITMDLVVGESYPGQIVRIESYGAFLEIPGTKIQGMVHVSNLGKGFIKDIHSVIKVGDTLEVQYLGKDEKGRIKFTALTHDSIQDSKEQYHEIEQANK